LRREVLRSLCSLMSWAGLAWRLGAPPRSLHLRDLLLQHELPRLQKTLRPAGKMLAAAAAWKRSISVGMIMKKVTNQGWSPTIQNR